MVITSSERDGVRVLACVGALSIGAATDAFESACTPALGVGVRGLVLDLTGLTHLDSAGVGSVIACAQRASGEGAPVKIVLPPAGPIRRIFTFTQLEKAFEIFEDLERAVRSF